MTISTTPLSWGASVTTAQKATAYYQLTALGIVQR